MEDTCFVAGMGLDFLSGVGTRYASVHDISIEKDFKDYLLQPFGNRLPVVLKVVYYKDSHFLL